MNFFKKLNEKRKEKNREIENKFKEQKKLRELKLQEEEAARERKEAELVMEVKEKADNWKNYLLKQFNEHRLALYEEWDNSCTEDQYGNFESDFFDYQELHDVILFDLNEFSPGFNSGFNYFFKKVIMRDISAIDFNTGWRNYKRYYNPKDDE